MENVFIDSCIVIDYIKGVPNIKNEIKKIKKPCINFIVEMELMQGANNKRELQMIKKELRSFWRLPMKNDIAKLSTELIDFYSLSHGLTIPDGIIASTSLIFDIPLFTYNLKDFKFIPNIKLYDTN